MSIRIDAHTSDGSRVTTVETPANACATVNPNPASGVLTLSSSGLQVTVVDPLCDPDWDRLVCSHPNCDFFHSAAWAKVLCKTYGHKPIYLHFFERDKSLALVPIMEIASPFTGRRGVCLPFSDFCEPLIFDDLSPEPVMNRLSELAGERHWKYFEIRGGSRLQPTSSPAVEFYGHKLALGSDVEMLYQRFSGSTRRAIQKAKQSDLQVHVSTARQAIQEFYQLHTRTRRRHGSPPQPYSFFLNIHEQIFNAGLGFAVMAHSSARLVAAAVFFQFGKKATYKFAASDPKFQALRGNNLVLWEGIRFLVRSGVEILHFGRTAADNEGLRRFKSSWGAKGEPINYFRLHTERNEQTARHSASVFHQVFRRLPLTLNRMAGAMIYPHLD